MKEKYSDFHDLIILGHNANLTPRQIFERFIAQGLSASRVPSPGTIRHLGVHLLGAHCKWIKHNMRSWRAEPRQQEIFWKIPNRRS